MDISKDPQRLRPYCIDVPGSAEIIIAYGKVLIEMASHCAVVPSNYLAIWRMWGGTFQLPVHFEFPYHFAVLHTSEEGATGVFMLLG